MHIYINLYRSIHPSTYIYIYTSVYSHDDLTNERRLVLWRIHNTSKKKSELIRYHAIVLSIHKAALYFFLPTLLTSEVETRRAWPKSLTLQRKDESTRTLRA